MAHEYPDGYLQFFDGSRKLRSSQLYDRTEPHKQGKVATNNERLNSILTFVKENKEKPIIRRSTSSPCRKHLKEHVA
jgi:hypothetical protein